MNCSMRSWSSVLAAAALALGVGAAPSAHAGDWDRHDHRGWRGYEAYPIRDRYWHRGWFLHADGFYYPYAAAVVVPPPPPVFVAPAAPIIVAPPAGLSINLGIPLR